MRVLVTGGAGFIGSHLTDAFCTLNQDVSIIDNFTTGSLKNLQKVESQIKLINGDIRDNRLVYQLVSEADLVYHMAASLGVSNIINSTLDSISVNLEGSNVVLKAAAKYDKRIIIASTSEIYGKSTKQPLSETDDRVIGTPQKIRWSYSDAKAIEEAVATVLHQTMGLRVTIIRLFNTVGPRQKSHYGMVLPRFIEASLKNQPLNVYGDGTQTRVFCHVLDVVDALLKVVNTQKTVGEVYNLGGVGEISINDLARKVIKHTSSSSEIVHIPYNKVYPQGFEDMLRRVPNIMKIRSVIDWEPKKDLNQIIKDIVNSLQQ